MSTDWETAAELAGAFDKASEGDSGDAEFSAAYELAEFVHAAAKRAEKVTLHVCVIEWPSDLGEEPALILTRDKEQLHDLVRDNIAEMLDAMVPEALTMRAFRAAFTESPDDFVDHVADYDGPFLTYSMREV